MDIPNSFFRLVLLFAGFFTNFLFVGPGLAQNACQTTNDLSCSVYTQCIEQNCNCSSTDFPYTNTFGPKYCQRFASETGFSALGQQWRNNTLSCLRDRISSAYVSNSNASGQNCDCSAIQSAAISSHSECYLATPSFCTLSEADVRTLARIVDAADMFALGSSGMAEMAHVLATCYWEEGLDKGNVIASAFITETLQEGTELASQVAIEILRVAVEYAASQAQKAAEQALRELYQEYFPTGPVLQ